MEKKKTYQKKNSNNRSFRNNNLQADIKEKRYSKAKFRKDAIDAAGSEVRKDNATKVAKTPRRDYSAINLPTKFQFEEKPTRVYHATLVTPTLQQYGYSIIPKGQMVKVEEFESGYYRRVTAQDGRQGIVYSKKNNLKALQFS